MAGRIRDSDDDDVDEQHEINITPFIDVMLVLLIIFMVAAPLSTVDIAVQLPAASVKPQPRPEKPVYVSIKSTLEVAVGEEAMARHALIEAVERATKGNRDARLFLRADKTVPYGELITILDLLRTAGYLKVGLVAIEAAKPAALNSAPGASATPAAKP